MQVLDVYTYIFEIVKIYFVKNSKILVLFSKVFKTIWSKTCNLGMVRRENISIPLPPGPRRQHFRGKNFWCPFQYPKVPLEAGAPPQSFDSSYAPVCKR